MQPNIKIHKAIQIILHRQYFEKTYIGMPPVKYIDYQLERDDQELLEYEKKTNSYLISVSLYDYEYDKIKSICERIAFSTIKKYYKAASLGIWYKHAKVSEM